MLISRRAILRFVLLRITRRPLVSPPIPEREVDPTGLPPSSTTSSPTLAPSSPSNSPPSTPDHLRNNHIPLLPHSLLTSPPQTKQTTPVEDYLLSKALTTSSVKAPSNLVKPLTSPKDWIAESLYILRPLVYGMVSLRYFDVESGLMTCDLQYTCSPRIGTPAARSSPRSPLSSFPATCVVYPPTRQRSSAPSMHRVTAICSGISCATRSGRHGHGTLIFSLSGYQYGI